MIVRAALASLAAHAVVALLWLGLVAGAPNIYRPVSPNDETVALSAPVSVERRRAKRAWKPSAFARFDLRMAGRRARLRRGQGYYEPLSSWHQNGVRYYRVAYAFVYRNGTYESGLVPWPVRFAAGADPFARGAAGGVRTTPLPPPPLDYMPPGTLGKALRAYFPQLRFED